VVQTQVDELLPLKNKLDVLRKRVKEIKRAITEVLNSDEDMAMMTQLSGAAGAGAAEGVAVLAGAGAAAGSGTTSSANPDYADGSLSDEAVTSSAAAAVAAATAAAAVAAAAAAASAAESNSINLEMLFENYLNEVEWISAELEEEVDEIRNTEENVVLQLDLLRNRILKVELQLSIGSFVVTCGALVTGLFGMNLLNRFEQHPAVFYLVTTLLVASMSSGFVAFRRYAQRQKLF